MRESASVSNTFIALTDDRVCTVALRAAWKRGILTFEVALAFLITIKEMGALVLDTASGHALETKLAYIFLLFATMKAD